jgi:hypothetical protein
MSARAAFAAHHIPSSANAALTAFITDELAQPTMAEAQAFAKTLSARPGVLAILFYGSCLQRGTTEGMLDFYALTDGSDGAWDEGGAIAAAGRALPPNVYPVEWEGLRAKVAVVPLHLFHQRMTLSTLDTTFWARFCQRAALLSARDDKVRQTVAEAIATGVETAAIWAERLASGADGTAAWRALFARTYRVEIRVESRSRASDIVGVDELRFKELWRLTVPARAAAPTPAFAAWTVRWWMGKVFHLSRLTKAAFTFEGGPRYLIWKIRRHMGQK